MSRWYAGLVGFLLPCTAVAQTPAPAQPTSVHASYGTYAAGLEVAQVEAGFSLTPRRYEMNLSYHTTGMVGLFLNGHQSDHVDGSWSGRQVMPLHFIGQGHWRGSDRLTEIDYQQGNPSIRQLLPPNDREREPVADPQRAGTIDTLSALIELIRTVADTGRCETTARTYDGRRLVAIDAHTVGDEVLERTGRSVFAGKALRCDFSGRLLAGFKFDDDRTRDSRPMHGSAWLAPVVAGVPPLPVRMTFETRWFGDATMYLTSTGPGADLKVARGN